MLKNNILLAVICSNLVIGWAVAQPADKDSSLQACVRIASDKDRLRCYDSAMGRTQEIASTPDLPEQKPTVTPEEAFGSEAIRKPDEVRNAQRAETLEAKVQEMLSSRSGGLVFILDNEQIWRQLESQSLPPIRVGDPVVIKRGALGSYRMTLRKQSRTITVRRIK